MATYSAKNNGYTLELTLTQGTQNKDTNSTIVKYSLVLKSTTNYFSYYPVGYSITMDGQQVANRPGSGHQESIDQYSSLTLVSGSTTIYHNSNGEKTFSFSFSAWVNDSEYYLPGTISGSGSMTLTTIPRASTITSVSDVTLGGNCIVKWTPASSSFRYKLKFTFGTWEATTAFIEPKSISVYSYNDTIPLSVANQIPNNASGSGNVYLYTYNGDTQIGSVSQKQFTAYVPSSIVPSVDSAMVSLVNSNSVISGWGIAVAGYTKLKISALASSKNGASVTGFTISGWCTANTNGDSLSYTTPVIYSTGDSVIKVAAKDSRGRVSSEVNANSVYFNSYSMPKITKFVVGRSGSDIEKVTVTASWSFSSLGGKNSAIGTLYYRQSASNSWVEYGTVTNGDAVTLDGTFSKASSYSFRIFVADAVGNSAQQETPISTMEVLMSFRSGGKGIAFGKFSEENNFTVAMDARFDSAVTVNGTLYANDGGYFRGVSLVEGAFRGTSGQNGYVKIMTIQITTAYENSPILFEVTQRGKPPMRGYIRFKSLNGTDPEIDAAVHERDENTPFFLVKSAPSVWGVYIQKSEPYDNIAITRLSYDRSYGHMLIDVTKGNNDTILASLPSGYVASTPYGPVFSYLTTTGKATLASAAIGGNNVALVTTEYKDNTNSNEWKYRKYSDGSCDLWCYKSLSDVNVSTAMGSWYRSDNVNAPNYPFTLKSWCPTAMFLPGGKGYSALVWPSSAGSGTAPPAFYLIRASAQNGVDGYLYLNVHGRWK